MGEGGEDEERRRERGEPDRVKVRGKMQKDKVIVYNTNTIRTKIIVQISEMSLFHNNVYSYEVETQTSVLIKQGFPYFLGAP